MASPWIALLALALVGGRVHPMHTTVAQVVQENSGGRVHPMHTTVTEVVQANPGGRASIQVRVYVDDLRSAISLSLPAGTSGADSAMARYLRATFALADRTGRPVRLAWAGAERTGDVILLRLRGEVPGGLSGARVTSLVLCERFEDQVNVVRAEYAGRTTTLLFTRGETAKVLP